ncbi:putative 4-coumarate--CoA ligase 3 [Lachnellula cervina]|uniref:Putative 4-coumarate--CoA ligase 3 n=1 Tax=Lachnellula cervina TaxID=1316786 RepID=A0A7D8UMW1_9HELO|nr:putative 4-coumarate--CoA ligase 3 [Lachnellula cervina]
MTPVFSDLTVHLRTDRSITQFMQENVSNTNPLKIICEDTLTGTIATYGSLREDALRAAHSLRYKYNLRADDVVSIISRSCVGYIIAAHAIWAAGGVVSTINHSSTADEIAHAIQVIKPKIFIVDAFVKTKLDAAMKLLGADLYNNCQVITMVSRVRAYPLFPDDLITKTHRIEHEAYVLDGKDARKACAAIVLSSGTTGSPKAVMLSHHNLVAICEQLRAHNTDNWRGSMKEIFFPLMQEKQATLARIVPTIALALAESKIVSKYTYTDLEYFSCAAAPLKPFVAEKLRNKFPGVSLCQTYGCTELSSCVSQSGVRDTNASLVATGTLLANIGIRFVNEQLQDVPPHHPGEICVSSPTIMMGYKDNEVATRESMLEPGWYRTGDIGYLDAMGYLNVVDRIKDVIKNLHVYVLLANDKQLFRFQVSPTELEDIIGQHPHVDDSAVTSIWDDSEATEIPRAFVVPVSSMRISDHKQLAKEIQDLVISKAAGYKRLRGGVKFVGKLPRNATGKLLRRQLRDEVTPRAKI